MISITTNNTPSFVPLKTLSVNVSNTPSGTSPVTTRCSTYTASAPDAPGVAIVRKEISVEDLDKEIEKLENKIKEIEQKIEELKEEFNNLSSTGSDDSRAPALRAPGVVIVEKKERKRTLVDVAKDIQACKDEIAELKKEIETLKKEKECRALEASGASGASGASSLDVTTTPDINNTPPETSGYVPDASAGIFGTPTPTPSCW